MQKLEKKVSAVLVAAGSSTRMGFDKLSFDLGGETVLHRSIRAFDGVSAGQRDRAGGREEPGISWNSRPRPAQSRCRWWQGGATRAESAKNGVLAAHGELVAVHDAARPFVSQAVITAALEAAAARCGAAAPAVPVKDTVKRAVRGDGKTVPEQLHGALIPLTAAPCMRCRRPSASTVRRIWPRWTSWMRKKPAWSPMTAACLS